MTELQFYQMRIKDLYELYGVSNSTLYYYAFSYNNATSSVKVTHEIKVNDPSLRGSKFSI